MPQRQDPRNPFPFSDPIIEISDHRKTLPYRGQQRFASWLGYVWPRSTDAFYPTFYDEPFPELDPALYGVEEGLNGAQGGFFRVLEAYSSNCVEKEDDDSSVNDYGSCDVDADADPEEYPNVRFRKISAFAPGLSSLVLSLLCPESPCYGTPCMLHLPQLQNPWL